MAKTRNKRRPEKYVCTIYIYLFISIYIYRYIYIYLFIFTYIISSHGIPTRSKKILPTIMEGKRMEQKVVNETMRNMTLVFEKKISAKLFYSEVIITIQKKSPLFWGDAVSFSWSLSTICWLGFLNSWIGRPLCKPRKSK